MAPRLFDVLLVVLILALLVYVLNSVLDWLVPLCFMAASIYVFLRLHQDGRI